MDRSKDSPRISLVIPAYNEEALLPRLLDTVDAARAAYRGGPEAVEVIVADNDSTDRTAEIAKARGARVAHVEKRVIAAARNGGAAVARGEILCFIDADSQVHPDTFNVIEDAVRSGRYVAGTSRVTMERWSLGLAVTQLILLPVLILTRMDTGVVFCRRSDFEAVGGYNEERLFAEDVQFLLDLRRLGKARGQRLVRLRGVKAVASVRKFDKHGQWHYLTQLLRLVPMMIRSPTAISDWARRYWYEDRS